MIPIGTKEVTMLMLGTAVISNVFLGLKIVWQNEYIVMQGTKIATTIVKNLFPAEVWADPTIKKRFRPTATNTTWGAIDPVGALLVVWPDTPQAESFAGELTIEITNVMRGGKGLGNSGAGGNVIFINSKGRNGQKVKLHIKPTARINAGGGGGGRGGQGGAGSSTTTESAGPSYNRQNPMTYWSYYEGGGAGIWWGGTHVHYAQYLGTSVTAADGWTYTRGEMVTYDTSTGGAENRTYYHQVSRTRTVPFETIGGLGGRGGDGQGATHVSGTVTNASGGSNGAAGGTGAGAGGRGGAGSPWGEPGKDGLVGNAGSVRAGALGEPGGNPGAAVRGLENCILINESSSVVGLLL